VTRPRLRDLGISVGRLEPGDGNAITDVPGVLVGHATVIADEPRTARTGVTMIVPRGGDIWENYAFCGVHVFNGNGEMTGIPWIEESGLLGSAIGLTNTHQVGIVRDELVRYSVEHGHVDAFILPVVAETWDGHLNDIDAFHVTAKHARAALTSAAPGAVAEGGVGGGTGMVCHEFKGGIGTSSRVAESPAGTWTVGALVQANYGSRQDLRIDGVPVGREIGLDEVPGPGGKDAKGSIIVVLATDAPLLPVQCKRLARRATVGLARTGGYGHDGSGDLFLAFATGNEVPAGGDGTWPLAMVRHAHMDPLFLAASEAVEEAILNALCRAETMDGHLGVAHAIPVERLAEVMARYGR
jgi:D-aminopeptidase